jgi:proteasome alpha subunit
MKPFEVEILVAEVGARPGEDQLFHILYDGTIVDEERFSVLGGEVEAIASRMEEQFTEGWAMDVALQGCTRALAGDDRTLVAADLEVAVLTRTNGRRAFKRIDDEEVAGLLG